MENFTEKDIDVFCRAPFFKDLSRKIVCDLFAAGDIFTFPKNTFVSAIGDNYDTVLFVLSGLLRVSAGSSSGRRVTFLLVKTAEPYNLLGPYLYRSRILEAQTLEDTRCLGLGGKSYRDFVERHPVIVHNILRWIGMGLDSANSRLLDLMEKKVENRILRVLSTLYDKFGSPLLFTSQEISEIAGTTPETTLRTMGMLRQMAIISTRRGKIWIHDSAALKDTEFGSLNI
ncbi:CRP-like cAMP-binding protein [Desulfosalsimonas propionicica]|uniref:CRP-like cAMP-binding protein n=1 Tax=Desulfosalsimonas propionicica TaxID=332175 RepID=A0A7W0CCT3_9BACT|nr:Crp/Fnr family transcriptional regulator [Desulfosalsimonas propionicica]MBA2883254.1 CRP-like cAMP-binding protein [Desulfosalsimonas propionicica]